MKNLFILSTTILLTFILTPQIVMAGLEFVGSLGGEVRGTASHKDFVFLSQRNSILAFNVHDKSNIRKIGTFCDGISDIGRLAIKWPVIFYVWSLPGSIWENLEAVDVSDPEHIHKLDYQYFPASKGAMKWMIQGNRLFVSPSDGVTRIYDLSNPLEPKILNDKKREQEGFGERPDSSEIHTPTLRTSLIVPPDIHYSGTITDVTAINNLVYIKDEKNRLKAFDLSAPQAPKFLGAVKLSDNIKVAMAKKKPVCFKDRLRMGNYEIRANTTGENSETDGLIACVEVSNPASPRIISRLLRTETITLENVDRCWVTEGFLFVYILHRTSGGILGKLAVIDLRVPDEPRYVGCYERLGEAPGGVSMNGDRIYVASRKNGMIMLRINDSVSERYE